jgi:predicted Rdx family selenoprotein
MTAAGNLVWATNSPANDKTVFTVALRLDPQGRPVVLATVAGSGPDQDILTLKFGSDGKLLWQARHDGGFGHDEAASLAVDQSGFVYAGGTSVGPGTGSDFVVVKYNADGQQVWLARYDGPAHFDERLNSVLG